MVTANPFWEYIRLVTFILMSRQYMIGTVIRCAFASNQSGIFMSFQVQGLSHIGLCWNSKKEKKISATNGFQFSYLKQCQETSSFLKDYLLSKKWIMLLKSFASVNHLKSIKQEFWMVYLCRFWQSETFVITCKHLSKLSESTNPSTIMSVSTIILNYPKHPNAGLGWIKKTEIKALDFNFSHIHCKTLIKCL